MPPTEPAPAMRCQSCQYENPPDMNFCIECAKPLGRRCAACGFENPAVARFCGKCANPLEEQPRAAAPDKRRLVARVLAAQEQFERDGIVEGEHKMVTSLFADIKGSMDLIEDLDPDEARQLVDPALSLMIDAVHRYDGYVAQSTGDGIFALFGAPVACEDHAARGLYAAMRMQEEVKRYAQRLRQEGKPPIEIRVGVNSGAAVVRSIRTGENQVEYTPIGHAVSLAARLQALAATGAIAVGHATQQIGDGYFQFKALGPHQVKGVKEPVEIFEVEGRGPLRTRLQASARRGLVRLVGRDTELAELRRLYETARKGRGQIVAAVGEAGVGKSRLFLEFKPFLQESALVLEGYCEAHTRDTAYAALTDMLADYLGFEASDDQQRRREKLLGRIFALDRSLEDLLPYLYPLLGIDADSNSDLSQMDSQLRERRTREAVRRLLLRQSTDRPLVLKIEDLHWIDRDTEQFLNLLVEGIAAARILLMVNYRPEYSHSWGRRSYYTQLRIGPLEAEQVSRMLDTMIGSDPALAQVRQLVVEKSEGTPLYIEELIYALFDRGVLVRDGGVRLAHPLESVSLPATLHGILASRIDRLPPQQKELLQVASVLGQEFSEGTLQQMAARPSAELEGLLHELQEAEFLYEQPAFPDTQYVFKHALTHDLVYDSLLAEQRKLLHERAAQALEATLKEGVNEIAPAMAEHCTRGGNAPRAIHYRLLSGGTMARTGLRMMPTFPSSSLRFRTAGFPQYGSKAGVSEGACPGVAGSSRHVVCTRPSCLPDA